LQLLLNFGIAGGNLELLGNDWEEVERFLERYSFDGIELMINQPQRLGDVPLPPKEIVKGIHFPFWMGWLAMWRGQFDKLVQECGSEDNVIRYFGGNSPDIMISTYRRCADLAEKLEAKYVVIHADHVYVEEAFTFEFFQEDMDVLTATAEFTNAALDGKAKNMDILFENSWWPGLRLNDSAVTREFLGLLTHPRRGLVLDTGHLMNSNLELEDEAGAVRFIEAVLDSLGDLVQDIRVVHLQKSLPGRKPLSRQLQAMTALRQAATFDDIYEVARKYAHTIDQHRAFCEQPIKHLIARINPEYLTYEFIASSKEELVDFVLNQHKCVGVELPR